MGNDIKAQSAIAGEYYLHGVTEVGTGFLLKPDSTFQFFFSYGALDREGSGKWTVKDKEIIFNSKPKPQQDFALISSKAKNDDFITIKITDNNALLTQDIYVKILSNGEVMEGTTNEKGEIKFPRKKIDSLSLVFQFCPEKVSVFQPDKSHNYFEFRFEAWITEYFFNDFHLGLDENGLRGRHPLLDEKEYLFDKRK
jgi:hypothetical protein